MKIILMTIVLPKVKVAVGFNYKHRMVKIKSRQSPYTLLDPAQYWLVASTLRDVGLVDRVTVNAMVSYTSCSI